MTSDAWIGQRIAGRYVVTRLIGKGGMGAVYEATETDTGRTVAIKFLLGDAARTERTTERFRREAKNASRVVHENVAQLYEAGRTPDGHDYIVMEYVAGTDLAAVLRDDVALSVTRSVAITRQILKGLAAIHAAGIVHRDVKPSNVLLATRDGTADFVKLGDFGLARSHEDVTLTKTGHIVGTTPFMAPEVFRGDQPDHRADLYAVGITLYQMLAGKLPFVGATAEVGAQHVWSPPPALTAARADLPAWLVAVVDRALAKAPADRFQDAREMLAALARGGAAVRPRRTALWALLAIAIVGGGAIGAYLARPSSGAPAVPVAEASVDAPSSRDAPAGGDAAVLVPPPDAGVIVVDVTPDAGAGVHKKTATTTSATQRCHCLAVTGESTPLCAKQGTPLCRCAVKGKPPLCQAPLADCYTPDAEYTMFRAGYHREDLCDHDTYCSDLTFEKFTKPAVHGQPCSGTAVHVDLHGYGRVTHGEPATGTWDCDSCPGANNQKYSGSEGDACTGYHWRTGAPTAGTLRHCDG